MRKLLTLLLTVCMLATFCVVPAGAASFELDDVRCDNVLGEATINYTFDNEEDVFKESNKRPISYENGALNVSKGVTDASESIDINADLNLTGLNLVTFRLKVDQESGITTSVLFGDGTKKVNAAFWIDFDKDKLTAQDGSNETVISVPGLTLDEYVEAKVLIDSASKKYYVWIGENVDIFNAEPIVDGFDFVTDNTINTIRIWRASHKTAATLYLDSLVVTPLKDRALLPRYKEYYEETFDSYTAGSDDFKTEVGDILVVPSDVKGNPVQCNTDGLAIVKESNGDNRLTVSYHAKDACYHNWYYPTRKPNPEGSFVVQVDVKGYGGEGHIRLGAFNDSKVPIAIKGDKDGTMKYLANGNVPTSIEGAPQFMYSKQADCDKADYVTLTILVNGDNYYLWANDTCLLKDVKKSNTSNQINSVCFYVKTADVVMYVDNIRVFEADSFLKIYNYMNSTEASFDNCVNTGSDGSIASFKTADEIFGADSGVTVTYSDDKGYCTGSDIAFPLFGATANSRVIFKDGNNIIASMENTVAFPSGYTTIDAAEVDGATVTISVTLRNAASARADELLVLAAAYDKTTKALVASKPCTLNEAKNAFVADFGTDVSGYIVRGFVWQNGTLRPIK